MLEPPYFLKDKVVLSKQLAWVSGAIGVIYTIISYIYFTPLMLIPMGAAAVAGLALLLHRAGHHNIARLLSGFDIALLIMIYQAVMVKEGDLPIAPLVLGAAAFSIYPFLVFHYSEKRYLWISICIIAAGFIFQEHLNAWIETNTDTSAHREPFLIYFTYIAATVVFISGMILASRNTYLSELANHQLMEEIQAQNEELRQQQEEIMSQRDALSSKSDALEEAGTRISQSIQASKALQRAVIPSYEEVEKKFPDSWVYHKAKDVVSGDFYWIADLGEAKIVVAADCTGHGVPGALMSMIGVSLLDKLVQLYRITSPNEILEKLHVEIRRTLRQQHDHNGMDMAIVLIEKAAGNNFAVTFAGAKRPLHIWHGEAKKIETLKPNRHSLGGKADALDFQNRQVELPIGSMLYMGSDGITDQSNSIRHKFGRKRLLSTLEGLATKPAATQKKAFYELMEQHMQGSDQRDDMLLVGIRLGEQLART